MLKSGHQSLIPIRRLNPKNIKSIIIKSQTLKYCIKFTLPIITKTAINWYIKAINWLIESAFLIIKNPNVITNPNIHIKALIIKINLSLKNHIVKIVAIEWEINPMEVKSLIYRKRKILYDRWFIE